MADATGRRKAASGEKRQGADAVRDRRPFEPFRRCLAALVVWGVFLSYVESTSGQEVVPPRLRANSGDLGVAPVAAPVAEPPANDPAAGLIDTVGDATSPERLSATLKILALLTVLSLAPSILMMTTCFVRFIIVLGLLRQALGTQQLPPNQVIVSLCLFLTLLVMAPVWQQSYEQGIRPYTQGEHEDWRRAFDATVQPLRRFMAAQIERTGNSDAVWMLWDYRRASLGIEPRDEPDSYDEIPLSVLLPAYMLSELKTAFVIGFQLYLPFVVIDMVVSSVLIGMGMLMLPPVLVSLPLKLLLFVLIDGWYLTVETLLQSIPLS